jgi:hypothetical protein
VLVLVPPPGSPTCSSPPLSPYEQLDWAPDVARTAAPSSASRAIIEPRVNMTPPDKSKTGFLSEAEIDARYGLEPAIGAESAAPDADGSPAFVIVHCPYCGEPFETSADASAGPCKYVEDCQVCCQPIDMELTVDDDGRFAELVPRRGD